MALSGDEIRKNLAGFVERWADYAGSERSEAQTFLNQLLACYGTDRQEAGARFEGEWWAFPRHDLAGLNRAIAAGEIDYDPF